MSKEGKDYDNNREVDDGSEDDREDDDDKEDDESDDEDYDEEDDDDHDEEDDDDHDEEDEDDHDEEDEDEEDDDDDDYERDGRPDEEYDDVKPPPQDDREPEYAGIDPRGQPPEYYQPEYDPADDEERGFIDEHEEEEKKRNFYGGNRCLMILAVLCCCILFIIALGLILYFLVFSKANGGGSPDNSDKGGLQPVPTRPPTQPAQVPSPRAPITPVPFSYPTLPPFTPEPSGGPTLGPTVTPAPTILIVKDPTVTPTKFPTIMPTKSSAPTQEIPDEIILIPIQDTYIIEGLEKGIAHGDEETLLVQNAIAIINQNPDSYALLKFDMSEVPFAMIKDREKTAILELTHVVSVLERSNATYTVERLPSINVAIETLSFEMFGFPVNGIKGSNFTVAPSDGKVEIDVTNLIFGGLYDPEDDPFALLMLANYGVEQEVGDFFRSRESLGNEPRLRISMTKVPGGSNSTRPSISSPPSAMPSVAPSLKPTVLPSAPPTVGN